jgi:hypothetical protein
MIRRKEINCAKTVSYVKERRMTIKVLGTGRKKISKYIKD